MHSTEMQLSAGVRVDGIEIWLEEADPMKLNPAFSGQCYVPVTRIGDRSEADDVAKSVIAKLDSSFRTALREETRIELLVAEKYWSSRFILSLQKALRSADIAYDARKLVDYSRLVALGAAEEARWRYANHHTCGMRWEPSDLLVPDKDMNRELWGVERIKDEVVACGLCEINPLQALATARQHRAVAHGWSLRSIEYSRRNTGLRKPLLMEGDIWLTKLIILGPGRQRRRLAAHVR